MSSKGRSILSILAEFSVIIMFSIFVALGVLWTLNSASIPISISSALGIPIEMDSTDGFVGEYDMSYYENGENFTVTFFDVNSCLEMHGSRGTSMLPFRKQLGMALVDHCFPPEDLEVNDVIIFYKQDSLRYIEHRIVEIDYKNGTVITKGDNNWIIDDQINFKQVVGKVIGEFNVNHKEREKEVVKDTDENIFIVAGSQDIFIDWEPAPIRYGLQLGYCFSESDCFCTSSSSDVNKAMFRWESDLNTVKALYSSDPFFRNYMKYDCTTGRAINWDMVKRE